MIQRIYQLFSVVLLLVALASCSSTKSIKKSYSIEGMSEVEYVEKVIRNTGGWDALTAKVSLSVD